MSKIVCSPDPVRAGSYLTVCYEGEPFPSSVTLQVRIENEEHEDSYENYSVDPDHPCFTVYVPTDTYEIVVADKTGGAEPVVVEVEG